ncbi:4-(cytidine 5'-diphospho)-2-C-methyl-D-erythritol kinase [uncultured Bacteroides sp.]|uniref:4-(cytidine 5'-diphospho)-2-C-methyl-D-erythritol kinase n=1 Tax=uncultured Bacteroides sp. TaxID=162156 RepID=UPI002AABA218|nr:4-(cytidine 5'-diphospho)-2-C-methyl-D-erythritol kinase [uncultured Bacteroides sp.]
MIVFPNAKINLGLNITEKRPDGYHNLETVFYPVHIEDALEVVLLKDSDKDFELQVFGASIAGNPEDNLVVKAYKLLKERFNLPAISIYLQKQIPSGAGMGGGSADGAFMLKLLNTKFSLGLSEKELEALATRLGADCPFFIKNQPTFATGTGNIFSPINISLKGLYILIVKPEIFVSTRDAFSLITPAYPQKRITEIIQQPVTEWKNDLVNDFEKSVFALHSEIGEAKNKLYEAGAIYASMSGSGSSLYGIFNTPFDKPELIFPDYFIWQGKL